MNKIKTLPNNSFLYPGICLIAVILFWFQVLYPQTILFFSILSFMLFYFVAEILDTKLGVFTALLSVTLQIIGAFTLSTESAQNYLIGALVLTLLTVYYFLIKMIRKGRLEKTTQREKLFRSLVNASLQPMILKNSKGEVVFASESIKKHLQLENDLKLGKNISEHIHPEDIELHSRFLKEVLDSPGEKRSTEVRLKRGEDWIWARNEAINLLDHKDIKAIVASFQDITTQKDIDRQKAELLEKEKRARSTAEKAVRDRDKFLSIASHELKTPLTTVLLQLQVTLRKISTQSLADFSGEELLRSLQIVEKQSQSLSTLIKDLLNVSLASIGKLTLKQGKS
jgi:PAS domain S-box-containing protein